VHQNYDIAYLAKGHFRETYLLGDRRAGLDDAVLKMHRYERNFSPYSAAQSQMEATMFLLTAASPHTTNAYGHCGFSILVEKGRSIAGLIRPSMHDGPDRWDVQKQLARDQVDDVKTRNNFTAEEKLELALAMSEALAELHGNREGAIANHDLSLEQYLLTADDSYVLKLNDFNKAVALRWNVDKQEYCTFRSHQTASVYRAPEELVGGETDESSDVNSFGKILFSLLTGLRPYYERESEFDAREAVVAGDYPYMDPRYGTRSFIEGRLVIIMERCYQHKARDRATIFDVVKYLRETARLVKQQS